jgi:hypothetical protein
MGARAAWWGLGRRRRVALALALFLIAALAALWLLRKPLATRYVDRTLAAAKVPARYTVADLGLGAQRLTNVVIGDPARPDLVADWIETRTRLAASGPELSGVRAGRLRVRGRLVNGKLSLGAIDRLLPKGDGGPFSLPPLNLSVEDGRMRLETPYGIAGVSLSGSGRLDGGFGGRLAVVSERLAANDCSGSRLAAALRVRSGRGGVAIEGPVNVASATCAGARIASLRSDLKGNIVLGEAKGSSATLRVTTGAVGHRQASADGVAGSLALLHHGGVNATIQVDLAATRVRGFGASAQRVALDGGTAARDGAISYAGAVALRDADAAALIPRLAGVAAGTPVAPLVDRFAAASVAAARRFSIEAMVEVVRNNHGTGVSIKRLSGRSSSGVQATSEGTSRNDSLTWESGWGRGESLTVDGTLAVHGGSLPTLAIRFDQRGYADPRRITVRMQPYEADGARLALTPVTIAGGRVVTRATLSGPLADGRVAGLVVPLDLRLAPGGLIANPACTSIAFQRLAISSLRLEPAQLRLCPVGPALVRFARGEVSGGARLAGTRVTGTLGSTPVALALTGATLRLPTRDFALEGVQTRIGSPGRVTRLDFARVEGRAGQSGIAGTFTGGAGQIANVPLLLSDAEGDWRFAEGALRLTGALGVSDAQTATPRFQPIQARGVSLGLVNGAITATGVLHEPTTGTRVATVAIRHALGPGTGQADLAVPNLSFAKGFQPELLTRLTFGVIADVRGAVSGEGRIAWSPQGVASTGTFRTAGTDLAAAFGPVTGIAAEIRFTDLLALESAPGQIATIRSVNPGIAVPDGTIRYRTLANSRVQVEGGEWPFAGGRLTLDPTLLDFSRAGERRMTFRIDGVAAGRFLQQFDFKNLDATGTFDGVLPMVFDESGGRIEGGRMTVREGGGTIRYVGDLTREDLGFWGDFAFQALKSLRYRNLQLTMNGPLAGEMITDVRFAGVSQGEDAKSNFVIRRLQRLPLVFNVRIKAPFRGLIDSAQSFYEPRRLIQRNLPQLIEEQNRARQDGGVQPPASAPVPEEEQR